MRTIRRQLSTGEADPATLTKISDLLTEHVRREERDLFPLVEELLDEDELRDLPTVGRRDV